MSKIPTAEEFLKEKGIDNKIVEGVLVQFTKLHVKAALEAAAENARIKTEYYHEEDVGRTRLREILDSSDLASERTDGDGIMYAVDTYEVNKKSILNAYPEENIK